MANCDSHTSLTDDKRVLGLLERMVFVSDLSGKRGGSEVKEGDVYFH